MTFSLFSVAILFVLAAAVLSGAVSGARKGFVKSFASLAALLASLLVSLVISPRISQVFGMLALNILKKQPFYTAMLPQSAYTDLLVAAVATMLISSVMFLVLLGILKMVFGIAFKVIYRALEKSEAGFPKWDAPAYERRPKIWGAAAGAVSGLLITIICLAPVTGTFRTVNKVIDMVDKADRNIFAAEKVKKEVKAFEKYANDGVAMMLYNMGGEFVYSAATCVNVDGETIYAVNELERIELLVDDFLALFPVLQNPASANSEHASAINSLCVHMQDSKMIGIIMAEFLPNAANAWLNDSTYMRIPKPSVGDLITPAFDGILEICAGSDMYTIKPNTISLLHIYSLFLESGILQAGDNFDNIIACIENYDLLAKLEAEIAKNPNMEIIKTYTTEIAMRAIADKIYSEDITGILSENYDQLALKMADAINTVNNKGYGTVEEKVAAMTEYAQEYLGDYGINIPPVVAEPVAEVMVSQIGSVGEISAESVQEFLKGYLSNQ
ncbi:MAG: hypothetical protein IJX27_05800 [Clostridia bacterium]|nr:hypothetical protein [Clostridia bacterium]